MSPCLETDTGLCHFYSYTGSSCRVALFFTERYSLRTAIEKKGVTTPSPAEVSGEATVSHALEVLLASLDDSKAEDIISIDLRGKSALGDYMVIASGRSQRHVGAVADHMLRALKEIGVRDVQIEGLESADWVLVDTGDIIVHIFHPEIREFYNIEKIWLTPEADEFNPRKKSVH
ncbi:ribosome silencing factor [Ochrobactrum sp. SFR4]|nr:ribosome silencing factor [Ochrobactrum sp. SFR4]